MENGGGFSAREVYGVEIFAMILSRLKISCEFYIFALPRGFRGRESAVFRNMRQKRRVGGKRKNPLVFVISRCSICPSCRISSPRKIIGIEDAGKNSQSVSRICVSAKKNDENFTAKFSWSGRERCATILFSGGLMPFFRHQRFTKVGFNFFYSLEYISKDLSFTLYYYNKNYIGLFYFEFFFVYFYFHK